MQSQGSEIGRICCIHKTRNESGKPQNRTIFVSFESIILSVFEMRQHRIRNMGVLINRDGGDYGSDVVTPTVEEEEENNSQADTQVIQNQHELTERRFPFFVPSNSACQRSQNGHGSLYLDHQGTFCFNMLDELKGICFQKNTL